jgi:adenylate cyclase
MCMAIDCVRTGAMRSVAIGMRERTEPLRLQRAPFHVLAVGKCHAVKRLLERIASAAPQTDLRVVLPDTAEVGAPHGFVPDLIFVDADSPHYTAKQLCQSFKRNLDTSAVPLIVVSCSARACEAAIAEGADDFATPQTPPALLLRRIEALVLVRQARRILRLGGEGVRDPQFPPLQWDDDVKSDDSFPSIAFDRESPVCRPVVVLFADLRRYTRICEYLPPGQVALLLKEYFSVFTQITLEHGGAVFNIAGDCLMAGFDVSFVHSDAADRALRAARVMMRRFASLAVSWQLRFHVTVGLGVGLHTGEVAIVASSHPALTNYTLIGDTVNVAARLCERARIGEIVLSASFKQALQATGVMAEFTAPSQVVLRGRAGPINIFCLPLERVSGSIELIPGAELEHGLLGLVPDQLNMSG